MLDPELLIGQVIDRKYRLASPIGAGSFGYVYAAEELALGEVVGNCALKLLRPRPDRATGSGGKSAGSDGRAAVLREISAMRQLSHPRLITLYAAGSVDDGPAKGCVYLAMELGESTLYDRLRRPQRLAPDEARTIARHLAEALAWLAERDAVHRDVKPENVFRVGGGWKLGDLGMARGVGGSAVQASGRRGTLLYMSPEAVRNEVGPATDVWALGVVLHESLSGDFPYAVEGDNDGAFIARLLMEEPQVAADLPPPFGAIVRGCLQKERTVRWTARQVLEALDAPVPPPKPVIAAPRETPAPRVAAAPSGLTSLGVNPQGFQEYRNAKDGSVLIHVPAGTFTIGSNESDNEKPPHRVTLDPFFIGKFAVTNAQFAAFVDATGHRAAGDWQECARNWGDDCPVVNVSWNDAVAYCQWAGLRLPSEAEWEHAARGSEGRKWPWGDTWDADRAWCSENSGGRAHPVGTKPLGASPCGAMDLAGNVWEWCSSKYAPYPYAPRDGREHGGGSDSRVLRGGSWVNVYPDNFRGAGRDWSFPDLRLYLGGFRAARTP